MATTDAPKAVFAVNPPIFVSMNDEMARQVIEVLEDHAREKALPPAVFAFKCALVADLKAN